MIGIIIGILFLLFYIAATIRIKILLFIINLFLPDPIPYIDEFIMFGDIVVNLLKVVRIIEFINEHKVLSAFGGIAGVVLLYSCIWL